MKALRRSNLNAGCQDYFVQACFNSLSRRRVRNDTYSQSRVAKGLPTMKMDFLLGAFFSFVPLTSFASRAAAALISDELNVAHLITPVSAASGQFLTPPTPGVTGRFVNQSRAAALGLALVPTHKIPTRPNRSYLVSFNSPGVSL
jgi:hypothetical protein